MGRIHFCESSSLPHSARESVCAVGGKILPLESAEAALCQTGRVRCPGELEIDLRKLFGVLSLSGRASCAVETHPLRFSGERSVRRTFSRRVYAHHDRQKY